MNSTNYEYRDIPETQKKRSHKKIIITATVLSIIAISVICTVFVIGKEKEIIYYDNLENAAYKMIDGAANAESAGNLITDVWYNAIMNEYDDDTDKFTLKDGQFVDDFNDALENLFADEAFLENIYEIRDNQDEVLYLMKQLKSPPAKYKEAYSVLKEYYGNYLSMTNMVISPSGSFQSFSDDLTQADKATASSFDKIKLYLN